MAIDFDKEMQALNEKLLNKNYSKLDKANTSNNEKKLDKSTKKLNKTISKFLKR